LLNLNQVVQQCVYGVAGIFLVNELL